MDALGFDDVDKEVDDGDWSDEETDNKSPEELFDLLGEETLFLSVGYVENSALYLPSTLGREHCIAAKLKSIVKKEIELRIGQANDALQSLRLAIGQKSFLFRTQLRNAKSKTRKTKAWDDISAVGNTVSHHRRVYHCARKALIALGASKEIQAKYRIITSVDVKSSTAIVDPNARGQRNASLAWFWSAGKTNADGALMAECA